MGSHWEQTAMGSHMEAQQDDTCGSKEETNEETKKKEKEVRWEVLPRDTARGDAAQGRARKEEIMEQTNANFQGTCCIYGVFRHRASNCWHAGKGKGGKGGASAMEWEDEGENKEEEEGASCVEEARAWG